MRDSFLAFLCGAAIFAGVSSLYLPDTGARPQPQDPAPYCMEVQAVATGPVAEKKKKPCNPACKEPQVCVDGTCCLPAVQHAPGSSNSFAWVEESLR